MRHNNKMIERFGNVPEFDIREFIEDDRMLAIPNVDLCYDDINRAINTYDTRTERINKLERFVKSVEFTMIKAKKHNELSSHDNEMLRQQIERARELRGLD